MQRHGCRRRDHGYSQVHSEDDGENSTMAEVLNRHKDVQYSSRIMRPHRTPAAAASIGSHH